MTETGRTIAASSVSGLIVGLVMFAVTEWSGGKKEVVETLQEMQQTQSNIVYRLGQIEPTSRRARNNSELIRRICDAIDLQRCQLSNAVWHPGRGPGGPLPPVPMPTNNGVVAHDKRRLADAA